jgi:hypothetical protein
MLHVVEARAELTRGWNTGWDVTFFTRSPPAWTSRPSRIGRAIGNETAPRHWYRSC